MILLFYIAGFLFFINVLGLSNQNDFRMRYTEN